MARNFSAWLSGFRDSIADYRYYIDFEKVHRNVNSIKVELNILNSLIGSKNIKEDFKTLIKKYPEVLKCIPLLLAVRANEIYCQDENGGYLYQFNFEKYPLNSYAHYDHYAYFMEHTGLFDLLENQWFTDGKGWTSARNNLEETFDVMEHIYNINDLENDIINEVFR